MKNLAIFLAAMVIGGCTSLGAESAGGGESCCPSTEGSATSGSRLQAKWITGEDGSTFFSGYHDTWMVDDCDFLPMSDGVLHCVPRAAATDDGKLFADASCTTPAVITVSCGVSLIRSVDLTCTHAQRIYAAAQADRVYTMSGATCVEYVVPAGSIALARGAEMSPHNFVSAKITTN